MMLRNLSGFKIAVALCCVLALTACSKKNTPNLEAANAGWVRAHRLPDPRRILPPMSATASISWLTRPTSRLKPRKSCSKQAAWLQQYPGVSIQVEGHADERGTREYNIALSARRATAAREFLIAQGVEANRISSIAYGKERPAALCDAEQCWTQNRRAVTVITGGARTS